MERWRSLVTQEYLQKTRYVWHCIYVSGEVEESCHTGIPAEDSVCMALYLCKWRGGGVLSQQEYLQKTRYVWHYIYVSGEVEESCHTGIPAED